MQKEFDLFCQQVGELLETKAQAKNYNQSGTNGPNLLYEFVRETVGGDHHAMGEIIYKARRFEARGDVADVLKIAAWAFLVWKYRGEQQ